MGLFSRFKKQKETPITAPIPEDKRNQIFSDLVESLKIYVNKNKNYKITKQGKENPYVSGMTVETYNIINKKGAAVYCHINQPPQNITVFKTILDFQNNIAECIYVNGKSKKCFIYNHKNKELNQKYLKYIAKALKDVKNFNPHYEQNMMPEPVSHKNI